MLEIYNKKLVDEKSPITKDKLTLHIYTVNIQHLNLYYIHTFFFVNRMRRNVSLK